MIWGTRSAVGLRSHELNMVAVGPWIGLALLLLLLATYVANSVVAMYVPLFAASDFGAECRQAKVT